ncbi:hypothetical protein Tco_1416373, partial [Tanacetum coccineum]
MHRYVKLKCHCRFQLADSWNNNVNDRLDGIRRKRLPVVTHVAENLERDYDEQTCLSAEATDCVALLSPSSSKGGKGAKEGKGQSERGNGGDRNQTTRSLAVEK